MNIADSLGELTRTGMEDINLNKDQHANTIVEYDKEAGMDARKEKRMEKEDAKREAAKVRLSDFHRPQSLLTTEWCVCAYIS